ncbi:phage baseplate assembly protein V [Paraburkholderia bonniea]|uniref:phage baseplate assembly protein V n=1 Tax=Paraburkholderia bonniea TaxID=2152891 RepID=UPI001291AA0A|nr:phage baseplate assembly protein V [Paraburkholderia bonniea]
MDSNEIQRQARNAVRKGSVLAVDHARALCRVAVGNPAEGDGLETNWIPWIAAAAGETRDWNPPTAGEQVILLCPMGDPAQGVALRGIYSDAAAAPSQRATVHQIAYPDGAVVQYDHAARALECTLPAGGTAIISVPGGVVTVETQTAIVKAESVTLDSLETTCTGSLLVKGSLAFEGGMSGKGGSGKTIRIDGAAEFTGDVSAAGVSVAKHRHMEQGDGAPTGEPIP